MKYLVGLWVTAVCVVTYTKDDSILTVGTLTLSGAGIAIYYIKKNKGK